MNERFWSISKLFRWLQKTLQDIVVVLQNKIKYVPYNLWSKVKWSHLGWDATLRKIQSSLSTKATKSKKLRIRGWTSWHVMDVKMNTTNVHLHIHHMSRIPFLIPSFLDFGRLCSEDSDFSLKLEEMYDFLDKRGYLASAVRATKLIVSQHHKRLRGRIMIECHSPRLTFHPHNHAVKSIILKNFKLLQNGSIFLYLNYT